MKEVSPDQKRIVEQLERSRLFKHLSAEQILRMVDRGNCQAYAKGERIIAEHEIDASLYVIIEGSVSVHVQQEQADVYIATLGPSEIFGEAGVFVNLKRTATVIACDESTVLRMERTAFMQALGDDPRAGLKILLMMVYSLLQKLREVNAELAFERIGDSDQSGVDSLIEEMLPTDAKEILE